MKYAVGVDLGGTFIKAGLISESGEITHATSVPTDARDGGAAVGAQIAETARRIIRDSGAAVVGIGVGSPGLILHETGVVHYSPNFYMENGRQWHDVPLAEHVREALNDISHLPVIVENDVNAMAFGEFSFGAGKEVDFLVGMTLGTGVGGGIVIDGQVYHGPSGTAGEIGHMTVNPGGRLCGCGNYGCLEAEVGTAGLIARTIEAIVVDGRRSILEESLEGLTPRKIAEAANIGDTLAIDIFADTGRYIGVVFASVANFLNPEMAVIGGGVSAAGEDLLFRHIRREVKLRAMDVPAESMQVVQAKLGNDAGMVGAATLALQAAQG